ncbi:DUF1684 domain-containing protein [Krasilnikoviella flava]|uniref:DUF1684 domain-containing protein n=1 Tax=Krasilnikoviella flava TaxID=526729 RepID=A0A1T5L7F9_9MICO|nr:DUF1684 domain-containing protein [Krasilnikoviella flava]SKC71986.1 hypothetical protein SAMN04324258_3084 [Krasilnikoviella flava]
MTVTDAPKARAADPAAGRHHDRRPDPAADRRARRHADREQELALPHGWLSLAGFHWLPSRPEPLPGVPGLWLADDAGAHLRPGETKGPLVQGPAVVDGAYDGDVPEGGSVVLGTFLPAGREPVDHEAGQPGVAAGGTAGETAAVAIELVRRTGRLAIRLRDPHARARLDFAGVPVFDHDPSWELQVPVRLYAAPQDVVVGAARPGLVHRLQAVGELDLTRGDRTVTLVLTGGPGGAPTLLFSDEAGGVAPWRVVRPGLPDGLAPGAAGVARLDLNDAVNLPYAFSDHGTCPAPPPGNHVPVAVAAGERSPR